MISGLVGDGRQPLGQGPQIRCSGMADTRATPPAPTARAWVFLVVRLAVTVALMLLVVRAIEWRAFFSLLERCDWRWWLAGFATGLAATTLAAVRWAALSRPIGFEFPTTTFVWRFFEGQFFNCFMPSSIGGDLVKAYRLADSTAGRLLAGCTVLADRLTGLSALCVIAVTALLAQRWQLETATSLAVGAALLGGAIAAFRLGVGSIDRILSLIPEHHRARRFLAKLLPYQEHPHLMTKAVGWSLIVQMGGSLAVAFMARSLGVTLPLLTWFTVVPLVTLSMTIPVTINGVGIREGGLAMLLKPAGVSADAAIAIGLLWFIATNLGGLIGGVLFMLDRTATGRNPRPAGDAATGSTARESGARVGVSD